MAHIHLPEGVPGIRGPMLISPETTTPLREQPKFCCVGRTRSLLPSEK